MGLQLHKAGLEALLKSSKSFRQSCLKPGRRARGRGDVRPGGVDHPGSMQRSADSKLQCSLQPEQVTWPPPESNDRIGGYKFLGGEAEAFCSLREICSVAIRQACGLWAHRQAILLISRALGKFEFAMKVLAQRAACAFLRTVLPCSALAGGGGAEPDPGRNRQPGTELQVLRV